MGTFTKKWAFLVSFFPVKKILEIRNFLATRFVRLVLAGLTDVLITSTFNSANKFKKSPLRKHGPLSKWIRLML